MKGKAALELLEPYQQGKQIQDIKDQYGIDRIVKLSSNENPYGYSSKIDAFLLEHRLGFDMYPDGYTAELRTALALKLKVEESEIVFGSGSEEIVQMICRAFLYPGVNTVMPKPTFPQYKHNAVIEGAEIKEIPTKGGYLDLASILAAVDDDTQVVWLCSPNNPTGNAMAKQDFYDFITRCPEHVLVVLDEAYYEYLDPVRDLESIKQLPNFKNLIILRTFSKAYGLAGLRIGYGLAAEQIITKLNVVRGPFNTTSIAQKLALIAWKDGEFLNQTISNNNRVKRSFQYFLDQIGWEYYPSETNFLLVCTPKSGIDLFEYLIKHGFIVRPGELLGIPNTIRLTLGLEKDMEQLQQLLLTYNNEET
ncbi:MAG: histidinol-phosphate transaminase [Bacillota bacterium]|uniref:Histidinol-phosphate aminotransferase n=1 Tax=Virgibacillus salarius TaxID=447199 RepID=A0A941I8G3_9BACI|nr:MULTISPECIES: histidinol-phosphate transaminase [Bacillaceae]NAZ08272.1 histidinol-phosphate transaminase [Agaribacter marinus]MBR7795559.1 histidinol-phosphate transaminase [Virgibacillus salarius]MCC2251233.1 histidinol-phosphate transaminase [Virgibacillus sp. AGTR]MDY7043374.1 histidinol-phosphate transaminase [Virgibacillus sp. M23]QRZ17022.1 histidinol-phosphate transaminase [Virgibacillus sp. AGTR]